jgi:superfamily I DNA/RNA helicase
LEFETVMLPEVTESAFPGFIEKLPPDIQRTRIAEATRLLYVALSRPKDKLIVSYHKRFGKYPKRLSPFLQTAEPLFKYRNWT